MSEIKLQKIIDDYIFQILINRDIKSVSVLVKRPYDDVFRLINLMTRIDKIKVSDIDKFCERYIEIDKERVKNIDTLTTAFIDNGWPVKI